MKKKLYILLLVPFLLILSCNNLGKNLGETNHYQQKIDSINQIFTGLEYQIDSLKKLTYWQKSIIDSLNEVLQSFNQYDTNEFLFDQINNLQAVENKVINEDQIVSDINIHFSTTSEQFFKVVGKDELHERYLQNINYESAYINKLSFVVSEVYFSILIEKINYGLSEEDFQFIESRYYYTGFDIAEIISAHGSLVNLKFIKWINYKSFVLREGDIVFIGIINKDGSLGIKAL